MSLRYSRAVGVKMGEMSLRLYNGCRLGIPHLASSHVLRPLKKKKRACFSQGRHCGHEGRGTRMV